MKKITKISHLIPDRKNANKGTQRGQAALEESLQRYGMGRSILVDKNGKIIAGNKTVEQAGQIGIDDVIVVTSDGTKIVAVQRTDLDLDHDPNARALAIADNRVGQLDLEWDVDQLLQDIEDIGSLDPFFEEGEIEALIQEGTPQDAGQDDPEPDESTTVSIKFKSIADKEVWNSYLNGLAKKYSMYETAGERIVIDISKRTNQR